MRIATSALLRVDSPGIMSTLSVLRRLLSVRVHFVFQVRLEGYHCENVALLCSFVGLFDGDRLQGKASGNDTEAARYGGDAGRHLLTQLVEPVGLNGQSVLVLGATGGIGAAVTRQLAAAGVNLLLHARANSDNVLQLVTMCRACGVSADFLAAQIDDAKSVAEFLKVLSPLDIDGLVVASGLDLMAPHIRECSFEERLAAVLAIDLVAPMRIARAVGKQMAARCSIGGNIGSIVLVGWDGAIHGASGDTAQLYGAAKGGLLGFARSLACDLAPHVRVNTVLPGWIKTRWGESVVANPSHPFHNVPQRESLAQRWGEPDEVAAAILFLLSSQASYISGAALEINGGERRSWRTV